MKVTPPRLDGMPLNLSDEALEFLSAYHLATLSTLSADGSLHVVPVGFTLTDDVVRVITNGSSQKVINIRKRRHATIGQLDGGRWISFIGTGRVMTDPQSVQTAVDLYAARYRQPRVNPQRVAIEIEVTRVMGSPAFFTS